MKKFLLALSLSLSLICICAFAEGTRYDWFNVKTQADVDEMTQNVKKSATALLALRQKTDYPFESYEKYVANFNNPYDGYIFIFALAVPELKQHANAALSTLKTNGRINTYVWVVFNYGSNYFSKEERDEALKEALVPLFMTLTDSKRLSKDGSLYEKLLDYYIKKILPFEKDAEAKKTLKTLNKLVYPLIEDGDENVKKIAVKIKLALETLD